MLNQLSGRGFRNLEPFEWQPAEQHNLLLGANGAGKTSLLEAIYTLATTRSFRAPRLAACVRHGEASFELNGEIVDAARARLALSWSDQGLKRAVNEASVGWADHLQVLPVVLWWSGALETLSGAPRLRRRLLDQGIVGLHPSALEATSRFRRVLRQKRELLARRGRGLSSWNEVFVQSATEVTRLRAHYTEVLSKELETLLTERGEDAASIRLVYRPSLKASLKGAEEGLAVLEEARRAELEQAQALFGPHRDDLTIEWRGHPISQEASAGEAKWIGLALAAARGRVLTGEEKRPLYLLDDLDAELDSSRLQRAFTFFPEEAQLIATSSRPEAWKWNPGMRIQQIERGRIAA